MELFVAYNGAQILICSFPHLAFQYELLFVQNLDNPAYDYLISPLSNNQRDNVRRNVYAHDVYPDCITTD